MSGRPPFNRSNTPRALTPGDLLAASQRPFDGAQSTAGAETAKSPAADPMALLEQFQGLLQQESSLDSDDRDDLGHAFEQALQNAASSDAPLHSELFDSATWHDTVDMLRRSGIVDQSEADHLVRTLNDALAPLQRRESQLAMEFSRRVEADGQEKALEWFREASVAAPEADAKREASIPTADVASISPLRADTIHSRSRRLRGPPR